MRAFYLVIVDIECCVLDDFWDARLGSMRGSLIKYVSSCYHRGSTTITLCVEALSTYYSCSPNYLMSVPTCRDARCDGTDSHFGASPPLVRNCIDLWLTCQCLQPPLYKCVSFRHGLLWCCYVVDQFINAVPVRELRGLYENRRNSWKVQLIKTVSLSLEGCFVTRSVQSGSFAGQ
jgi:hypothetical protein